MPDRDTTLNAIFTAENPRGLNIYNYRYPENPNYYTASGYWQIVNSTWLRHAKELGVDTAKWPVAIKAPYEVQRQVAGHILDTEGIGPWANYNPKVRPLLAQLDRGESPRLHTGPQDDGAGNPLAPQASASAAAPALGQDGYLHYTQPSSGGGSGLALPAPAPGQDPSKLVALGLLSNLLPSGHGFQPVDHDPFKQVQVPQSDFQASLISAPQLHPMPSGKAPSPIPQSPGSSMSVQGQVEKLLGDTGTPQVRGRPGGAGSSSQYG